MSSIQSMWASASQMILTQAALRRQGLGHCIGLCEELRLRRMKRYSEATTLLFGHRIRIVDVASYLSGIQEIFADGLYDFRSPRPDPTILDCGSNIGLSIIFFKMRYPQSRIVAFEADPKIFEALKDNLESFGFGDAELHNSAVWVNGCGVDFLPDGGASGRITAAIDKGRYRVQSVRLRDILQHERVDFLKLDIEGAETEVIRDCAEELRHIPALFVEYHSIAGQTQTLDELLRTLADAGFRYHVREAYAHLKPFLDDTLNAGCDLQLNVFCYRLEDDPCPRGLRGAT